MTRNPTDTMSSPIAIAAIAVLVALLASPALAQRSVPVFVDNDAQDPIPVALVQNGGSAGGSLRYILCLENINGPGVDGGFHGCSEASSLGLAVERDMKESGEKGGTEDINIGIGELSSVVVGKQTDGISATLFLFGVNGNSFGGATFYVREQRAGWSSMQTTLTVELDRTFVKSLNMQTSGLDEIVSFYFNKIRVTTQGYDENGTKTNSSQMCWDTTSMTTCSSF